jgi:hypothetical protein
MIVIRNLLAVFALITMVTACGLPVPFEWSSDPQTANIDDLLGANTFEVPGGDDAAQADARAEMERYFREFATEENWPAGLADIQIDVPILEIFPVDLSEDPNVASVADSLSAVAVDRLEVEFLQNSFNYDIPTFHFFTVDEGTTVPAADALDLTALPAGMHKIGTMNGVDAKTLASFELVYGDNGKQLLSDALIARKFNFAIYTQVRFDTSAGGVKVPSGTVQVRAHIAGRFLTE